MTPDSLINASIQQQVYLERVKSNQIAFIRKTVALAERDLLKLLRSKDFARLDELSSRQLEELIVELRQTEAAVWEPATTTFFDELEDLSGIAAKLEAKAVTNVLRNTAVKASRQAFKAALREPITATGELMKPFVQSMTSNQLRRTEGHIRRAWKEGLTIQDSVQRIRGTKANGFKDGITRMKTREAEAVARTSIQHVASTARQQTWADNSDLVVGYRWVSTLDSKTTRQCQALDGQVFRMGRGPTPPIHINCRSTTAPDMKDGLDFLDKGATRSAVGGPVSADLTYFDWLKKQPRPFVEDTLGTERAELFLDKGISADKFSQLSLDKFFRPLTNDELRSRIEAQ